MGTNGKVVFVAEVLALRVVFERGINIINSTIAVLLYNTTKQFRTYVEFTYQQMHMN